MPKLDATHLPSRIHARLEDLKAGVSVSVRDIKALLSAEQIQAMNDAWLEQQKLRKVKRARTKEEEKQLGWKSKREIYTEAYENALSNVEVNALNSLRLKIQEANVKASKAYLDAFFNAKFDDKNYWEADAAGNNSLVQAGYKKDYVNLGMKSKKDEQEAIEKEILVHFKSKLSKEDLAQYNLLQEHEKNIKTRKKK